MSILIKQSGSQGPKGSTGWSPEIANVLDGVRIVQKVVDWYGGEGVKPPLDYYIGTDGFVTNIVDALDIRGSIAYALINWRGAWSSATAYVKGDGVTNNGSSYTCKLAHTNQALTNTTYWDVVANKGESGDTVINFGNSLIKNGAFEEATMNNWTISSNTTTTLSVIANVVELSISGTSSSNAILNNTRFQVPKNKLIKATADVKVDAATGRLFLRRYNRDTTDNLVLATSYCAALNTDTFNNVAYESKVFYFGSHRSDVYATFSDAYSLRLILQKDGTSGLVYYKNIVIKEVPLAEVVPHNLQWLPDGQRVFDAANILKRGTYISSTIGIVWDTSQEITLQPNGTSIVFNLRRPYKFSWAMVYNDGVTIVSQPSATINANSDALLTLTGTAGKTLTLSMQQTV